MSNPHVITVAKHDGVEDGWDTYLDGVYLISVRGTKEYAAEAAREHARVVLQFIDAIASQMTQAQSQDGPRARGGIGFGLVPGSEDLN